MKTKIFLKKIRSVVINLKSNIRLVWTYIAGALTILGIVSYYFLLSPSVVINSDRVVYKRNPFYYPFRIVNNSNLPITNVLYEIVFEDYTLSYINRPAINVRFKNSRAHDIDSIIPIIKPHQSHAIDLSHMAKKSYDLQNHIVTSGKISVIYSFNYFFNLKHITDSTRFILVGSQNEEVIWKQIQY